MVAEDISAYRGRWWCGQSCSGAWRALVSCYRACRSYLIFFFERRGGRCSSAPALAGRLHIPNGLAGIRSPARGLHAVIAVVCRGTRDANPSFDFKLVRKAATKVSDRSVRCLFYFWIAASVVLGLNQMKWYQWPCPRCGCAFRGFWGRPWLPKRCVYCGLEREERKRT